MTVHHLARMGQPEAACRLGRLVASRPGPQATRSEDGKRCGRATHYEGVPCVARGFKACASFMFAGCCWWRLLAVDGRSGASRGHPAASDASYPSSEASHDADAQLP